MKTRFLVATLILSSALSTGCGMKKGAANAPAQSTSALTVSKDVPTERILTLSESLYQEVVRKYDRKDVANDASLSALLPHVKSIHWLVSELPESDAAAMATLKSIGADRRVSVTLDAAIPSSTDRSISTSSVTVKTLRAKGAEVHPVYAYELSDAPNEQTFADGQLYHLWNKTNPALSTNLLPVWAEFVGNRSIPMVIFDSGIASNPDLIPNYDMSLSRTYLNGGNAFNIDNLGHGTHVAGIACAAGNNGIGVVGAAWNCRLVAFQMVNALMGRPGSVPVAEISTTGALSGFYELAKWKQSVVVNASWGGFSRDDLMADAIAALKDHVMLVAAAGNQSVEAAHYPCRLESEGFTNVMCVGALDKQGGLAEFSNSGPGVNIAAFGESIYSTVPGGYGIKTGTSMASPLTAGVTKLIWEGALEFGLELTPGEIRTIMYLGARANPSLQGKIGRAIGLDAGGAWAKLKETYLPRISAVTPVAPSVSDPITLTLSPSLHPSLMKAGKVALQISSNGTTWQNTTYQLVDSRTLRFTGPSVVGTYSVRLNLNGRYLSSGKTFGVELPTTEEPPKTTPVSVVNAASFIDGLTPNSLATVFAQGMGGALVQVPADQPLPSTLGGATIVIKQNGNTYPCGILAIASGQANIVIPAQVVPGSATLHVTQAGLSFAVTPIQIRKVSPAVFAATYENQSWVVGYTTYDGYDYQDIMRSTNNGLVPNEIAADRGDGTSIYVVLYATGLRAHVNPVNVRINGVPVIVDYAGAQGYYPGLDQINFAIPIEFPVHGTATLTVEVDGQTSPPLLLRLK